MKRWTAGMVTVAVLTAATPAMVAWGAGTTGAELRADVDRDGLVTPADEAGESSWSADRGAIFLANVDDDERRCTVDPGELEDAGSAVDKKLAACNDAADERINGPKDLKDLAPLEIPATRGLSRTATGRLDVVPADKARIFADGRVASELTADQLRRGVRLGLEGRDVLRDRTKWDGTITVTLTVTDRGRTATDVVKLRVAPLMLQNDLQRAQTVFAGKPNKGVGWPGDAPYPPGVPGEFDAFAKTLGRATRSSGAKLQWLQGTPGGWKDMWLQDTFEPATASLPAVGGAHTMRVLIRSGNVWDFGVPTPRPAGRLLYRDLRGPDVGVVQELSPTASSNANDLLNMGGNIESLPPYAGHPHGRVLYGAGERKPDPGFLELVTGQGFQDPLRIDTSWLAIGHADETTHVVRADNARGWTLAVADPRLAEKLLRDARDDGAGGQRLFADTNSTRKPTVDEILADGKHLADNRAAAAHVDEQLAILLRETGLRRDELVRLPVFFESHPVLPGLRAMTPGLVNGLSLTARDFAAPDPQGPKVHGVDVFKATAERALRRTGVRVHWVDNFFWSHLGGGEVHCATNALRDTRATDAWWLDRV
ncbi:protein-arginine deiminase family protein [Kribbella sp. NPDC051770]|uniref:protein-arginine deiminase family protein n=1 Tax=Kribbella sp. NPDC051770 TaxID=3155413 RepID=UPI003417A099